MSHALRRLRELLDDPLLVRIGSRMNLTPRAQSLREALPDALDRVRALFTAESFVPATSARRFQVVIHDHLADVVVPAIVRRMSVEAPRARLEVLPWESPFAMTPGAAASRWLRDIVIDIGRTVDAGANRGRRGRNRRVQ